MAVLTYGTSVMSYRLDVHPYGLKRSVTIDPAPGRIRTSAGPNRP